MHFNVISTLVESIFTLVGEALPHAFLIGFQTAQVYWTQLHISEFRWEMLNITLLIELRLVWWRELFVFDGAPVYAVEPGVVLDILSTIFAVSKSLSRIFGE